MHTKLKVYFHPKMQEITIGKKEKLDLCLDLQSNDQCIMWSVYAHYLAVCH